MLKKSVGKQANFYMVRVIEKFCTTYEKPTDAMILLLGNWCDKL